MIDTSFRREIYYHLSGRDFSSAERALRERLSADQDDAESWFLRGQVAGARDDRDGRIQEMEMTRRAVDLSPTASEYRAQLARLLVLRRDMTAAAAEAERAATDPRATDLTLAMIAEVYTRLQQHRQAAAILDRAVNEGSRNPDILVNLASARKFCGDFDGAIATLEWAIAMSPTHVKARAALSAVRPATPDNNQIADYQVLLDRKPDPATCLELCHAAARECDALVDHDRAFDFLARGKQAMLASVRYDAAQDRALFTAIRSAFEDAPASTGYTDAEPIFVVGMPRSGTTLVDRILSGHPDVVSIGESMQMPLLLQQLGQRPSAQLIDPDTARALAGQGDMTALGRDYIAALPGVGEGKRPLDKFPLNSLLAGFIIRALPRAKIVCIHRGGLDTVVGNYRQPFENLTDVFRYALSLETIAAFYVEFRRLADFWAERFPANFLQVSYESLVTDPAANARGIFDFCGLTWDERFLRIEDNDAPVATASAVQVRQPITSDSIGQWRRYDRHLRGAADILQAAGIKE